VASITAYDKEGNEIGKITQEDTSLAESPGSIKPMGATSNTPIYKLLIKVDSTSAGSSFASNFAFANVYINPAGM
jgi:hypothetical protein